MRNRGGCPAKRLRVLIPLLLVCVMEMTVFNLPFWESLSFPDSQTVSVTAGKGLSVQGNRYTITDADDAILNLDLPAPKGTVVHNVALQLEPSWKERRFLPSAGTTIDVKPMIADEGHAGGPVGMRAVHVSEGLSATHYIRIHTAGKVTSLSLSFPGDTGRSFTLSAVRINARPPFHWSMTRFLCLLSAAYLVYAFWPTRSMYRWDLDFRESRQRVVAAVFLVLQVFVLVAVTQLIVPSRVFGSTYLTANGAFINDDNQYDHLADAILSGRLYLDLPVPDWLAGLPNPYSPPSRAAMSYQTGQPTYWDYAFFDGKYYTYFGVVPALLAFVPFKLLTGRDLRTDFAVAVFAVLFVLAAAYFLHQLFARYAKRVSLGAYLVSCLGFITGCGTLTQTFLPKIYSLPMLSSMAFTLFGLGLWMGASKRHGRLSKLALAGGALLIALNLGCRPQFILSAFLAFPIFVREIRERLFFSVRGIVNTLCVVLPFLLIGVCAMLYNHARFGSYFDFGAAYNLTGFDMVHSERSLSRIPWGIWLYLFQPLDITPNYPFMKQIDDPSMYQGFLIMEPMFGGFLAFAPVAVFLCLLPRVRREVHEAKAGLLLGMLLAFAALILVVDTRIVGVSSRYFSDFGWMLLTCACLCAVMLINRHDSRTAGRIILYAFVVLTLCGVFVSYWNLLSDGRYGELQTYNNTLYRIVESWFLPLA